MCKKPKDKTLRCCQKPHFLRSSQKHGQLDTSVGTDTGNKQTLNLECSAKQYRKKKEKRQKRWKNCPYVTHIGKPVHDVKDEAQKLKTEASLPGLMEGGKEGRGEGE